MAQDSRPPKRLPASRHARLIGQTSLAQQPSRNAFHTAQAVRRTRAVIGCFMQATNIESPPWCALQRLAIGWAQGCLMGAFLFLRQPRIAGRRALLLLLV
jgi:hypothetical protein